MVVEVQRPSSSSAAANGLRSAAAAAAELPTDLPNLTSSPSTSTS